MRRYFIYMEYGDNKGTGFLVDTRGFDTVAKGRKYLEKLQLPSENKTTSIEYNFLVQDEPAPKKVTLQGGQDVQITELGSSR